jgi:hypothetical protein
MCLQVRLTPSESELIDLWARRIDGDRSKVVRVLIKIAQLSDIGTQLYRSLE